MRGEEAVVDEEESSQCSSGCQSGWTLYLDHSGSGQQQCRSPPCHPADVRREMLPQAECNSDEEEDSMVSDASSGPPHHLRDDQEELRVQINILSQQRRSAFGGDQCYGSGIGGDRRSGSVSGSSSFVSTRSRGLGEAKSRKKRRTVVQRVDAAAMRCHGLVDDGDLNDTASSSAIVAPADVAEAMSRGGDDVMDLQQPSWAFSDEHYSSLEWPVVRSTGGMQGLAMLHHS